MSCRTHILSYGNWKVCRGAFMPAPGQARARLLEGATRKTFMWRQHLLLVFLMVVTRIFTSCTHYSHCTFLAFCQTHLHAWRKRALRRCVCACMCSLFFSCWHERYCCAEEKYSGAYAQLLYVSVTGCLLRSFSSSSNRRVSLVARTRLRTA